MGVVGLILATVMGIVGTPSPAPASPPPPAQAAPAPATATLASWEGAIRGMSTAHPWLPRGTLLEVHGPRGDAVVTVRDSGPDVSTGRGLDLSPAAFRTIVGPLSLGVGPCSYQVLS